MRFGSSLVLVLCLLAVSCGSDSAGQDSVAEEVRGPASSLVQDVELVLEGDGAAETLAPTLESLAASLKSLAESIEALASSHSQENTEVAEALRELSFATWINAVINCKRWRIDLGPTNFARKLDCEEWPVGSDDDLRDDIVKIREAMESFHLSG